MFCPFCSKQNKDNAAFCDYCGKALPQTTVTPPSEVKSAASAPLPRVNPTPNAHDTPKPRLSYNAKRGIVTGVLVLIVVVVVLAVYYPSLFHF
jgi:uncharacterized membrane protein YvbJ